MDTIFALASAPGKAGVAVVRISGPQAFEAFAALADRDVSFRKASLTTLKSRDGVFLDQAMTICFEGPASFTGEDVVELHLHGSAAVIDAVLSELSNLPGCRIAQPGEFTRRALQFGKMDVTQVEGLADLIEAETEAQRVQAQAIHSGEFREFVERLRSDLIESIALLEACIDFADEEIPEDVSPNVLQAIDRVEKALDEQIEGQRISERIRDGFEVAIVGKPNVGKSTLLNALVGREAAITSEYAGTTRDVIEVRMDLDGIPVTILDTAGVRDTDDPVEKIGVQRAQARADAADIRVYLVEDAGENDFQLRAGDEVLVGKADLRPNAPNGISGATGQGVEELLFRLTQTLRKRVENAGLATRVRHRDVMMSARTCLEKGREHSVTGPDAYDLASEELRMAVRWLESIVGRVDLDDYLDYIFSTFCLGK